MARITRIRGFLAAAVLAVVTTASAQEAPHNAMASGSVGPNGLSAPMPQPRGGKTPSPGGFTPSTALSGEPVELAGMLAAQNDIRNRQGLVALSWSSALGDDAAAVLAASPEKACTYSSSQALASASTAVYWAAAIRQSDGQKTAQTLSPNFVVSEWWAAGADYDSAADKCRRPGACISYARMVAPKARLVGCAKLICPTQAQLWVCRYGDKPVAATR